MHSDSDSDDDDPTLGIAAPVAGAAAAPAQLMSYLRLSKELPAMARALRGTQASVPTPNYCFICHVPVSYRSVTGGSLVTAFRDVLQNTATNMEAVGVLAAAMQYYDARIRPQLINVPREMHDEPWHMPAWSEEGLMAHLMLHEKNDWFQSLVTRYYDQTIKTNLLDRMFAGDMVQDNSLRHYIAMCRRDQAMSGI